MSEEDYNHLGVDIGNMDKFLSAIRNLTKSIELNPYNSVAFYKRGYVQAKIRNFSEAISDLDNAIKINREYVEAYRLLGICQYNSGIMYEAKKNFELALKLGDEHAEALLSLFDQHGDENDRPF